jgi:hypothetical protein
MSIDPKQLADWKALADVVYLAEKQMRLDDIAVSVAKDLARAVPALIAEVERLDRRLALSDGRVSFTAEQSLLDALKPKP